MCCLFRVWWIIGFPLVSFCFVCFVSFPRETQKEKNPRKTQTNQGKFKEAINSQNASMMPVSKEVFRHFGRCQKPN